MTFKRLLSYSMHSFKTILVSFFSPQKFRSIPFLKLHGRNAL